MGGSAGIVALVFGVIVVAVLIGAFVIGARRKEREPPPRLGPNQATPPIPPDSRRLPRRRKSASRQDGSEPPRSEPPRKDRE